MKGTLWDKRFGSRERVPVLERYNASIARDRFLAPAEICASKAYAQGLHRAGLLTDAELREVLRGLTAVAERIGGGEDLSGFEDIHSAVEIVLVEEIGEPGRKLHTGRSRNEQVATDERIFLKAAIAEAIRLIEGIQRALVESAEKHFPVIMPGYTHLQRAQAVLFPHYLMSFFWPLERGKARLYGALERTDVLPLGSGALAGSTAGIDRGFLMTQLGFAAVSENSIDAVTDRSFILETLFALGCVLLDLSRLGSDVALFVSAEFGFLEIEDSLATSSSLMPQKKNPDILELVRAAPARLFGYLHQLTLVIKGLPSSYNKDLQEDKEPLERGVGAALETLEVVLEAVPRIRPVPERMAAALDPSVFATDLADSLAEKGVPFREAHGLVAEAARYASEKGRVLNALTDDEWRSFHPALGMGAREIFDSQASVARKRTSGSTHPDEVRKQIEKAKALSGIG